MPSTKPIFVVGTPRSGTTLTAKIIGRHSEVFMPGETHYFEDVFSRSRQFGDITDDGVIAEIAERLYTLYARYYEPEDQERIEGMFPSVVDLGEVLSGCKDHACVLECFMSEQMEYVSKRRWGNNAPRDLFSVREIRNLFPDAKFVVCVRDIRAFLLSYQGRWRVIGEEWVDRFKKLYHPVVTSYLWKSSMRQISLLEKLVSPSDRIVVRYEDLVSCTEATVQSICDIIEVEYEPAMLDVQTHNSSSTRAEWGIFSSSVERWKQCLTPEEISIAQNIARKELRQLGYSEMPVSPAPLRILGIWAKTPAALWKALDANKNARGPLIPYLAKRFGALLGADR